MLVAVVDDEQSVRRALERLLRSAGYAVESFGSGCAFLDAVQVRRPDCAVLDVHMPQMDGVEVQARLAQWDASVPVVIITGHDSPLTRERMLRLGVAAYLRKPVDDEVLLAAIRNAIASGTRPRARSAADANGDL